MVKQNCSKKEFKGSVIVSPILDPEVDQQWSIWHAET
jgi:hypothetical protein